MVGEDKTRAEGSAVMHRGHGEDVDCSARVVFCGLACTELGATWETGATRAPSLGAGSSEAHPYTVESACQANMRVLLKPRGVAFQTRSTAIDARDTTLDIRSMSIFRY